MRATRSSTRGASATAPPPPGAAPSHAYDSGGERTVTLTVTDPTGLTATATRALLVEGPLRPRFQARAPAPARARDRRDARPRRCRPPWRCRRRRSAGRCAARACASASARRRACDSRSGAAPAAGASAASCRHAGAGPNSVRFSGRLRVRGRTLSLAPGRYRLTLVATDAAGNRSAARRVPFRVISRGG